MTPLAFGAAACKLAGLTVMQFGKSNLSVALLIWMIAGPFVCCFDAPVPAATALPKKAAEHDCCMAARKPSSPGQPAKPPDCTACPALSQIVGEIHQPTIDATIHQPALLVVIVNPLPVIASSTRALLQNSEVERIPITTDLFHQNCLLTV